MQPVRSRPYWPDGESKQSDPNAGLKEWSWAEQRLAESHNYWISTSRPDHRPHLMVVWGVWWKGSFWFSTGPQTRKAKNLAALPSCVVATEKGDEAVILEGAAEEIRDRTLWKAMAEVYNQKYGGDLLALLEASGGNVYSVKPLKAFGQDEHAPNFVDSVTRWRFP